MTLAERLRGDLKCALQSKDEVRVGALRLLFAAIKNKEIEERKKDVGLGDEEILAVIAKEAKKRKDSISEYSKAGREDLAQAERGEFEILNAYMPEELSDGEIEGIVLEGLRESGARSMGDFGNLMKTIMPSLKGKASGERISAIAKKALGGS